MELSHPKPKFQLPGYQKKKMKKANLLKLSLKIHFILEIAIFIIFWRSKTEEVHETKELPLFHTQKNKIPLHVVYIFNKSEEVPKIPKIPLGVPLYFQQV